jgi:hypothetical protein
MFNMSIMCFPQKKSQDLARSIEFCPPILKDVPMRKDPLNKVWLPLIVALAVSGCTQDRTWQTLVPRNAVAVVLVDHPAPVAAAVGASAILPLSALDGGKPWVLAVVPSTPPGFLLALALDAKPAAWTTVQAWAQRTAGMASVRVGTYAVLSSPGLPSPGPLDPASRFDLTRLSHGSAPVSAYIDVANLVATPSFAPALRGIPGGPVWLLDSFVGMRLDFLPRNQGLEVRLTTDNRPGSRFSQGMRSWPAPVELAGWSGLLPQTNSVGAVFHLSPALASVLGQALPEPLRRRWSAMAPLLGPRAAVAYSWGEGSGLWSGAVETRDPQAVRQALKTLVAGGELQRSFPAWSLDADTPVIYRDRPDPAGGVRTELSLGPSIVHFRYGQDRVVAANGRGAVEMLAHWQEDPPVAPWFQDVPGGAEAAVLAQADGSGLRGAVRVLKEGNVEVSVWADGPSLKAWEGRIPALARGWLGAASGTLAP